MILQCHEGGMEFLPAIPQDWQNGYVKGLRAKGGFMVDVEWQDGIFTKAAIHSHFGSDCIVFSNKDLFVHSDGAAVEAVQNGETVSFKTSTGRDYILTNSSL